MLRACLKKRIPFQLQPETFTQSLFTLRKNCFSKSILDKGEYIAGDVDFDIQDSTSTSTSKEQDFKKKYVDFTNFNANLERQTAKPTRIFKADVPNSIKSAKGKFKFELAEDDVFNQGLRNRQKQPTSEDVTPKPVSGRPLSSKSLRAALDKIHKKAVAPDAEKRHLVRIDYPEKTAESQENAPLSIYTKKLAEEVTEKFHQSNVAMEDYLKGEEGVDYIRPAESLSKVFIDFHSSLITEVAEMKELYSRSNASKERVFQWRASQELRARIAEDLNEAKVYPGSSRGPTPEDDPEFFAEWLYANMPESSKQFYSNFIQNRQKERSKLDTSETQHLSVKHILNTDVPISEMGLTTPEKTFINQTDAETVFHSHINAENDEILPYPDKLFTDYQGAQDTIEKWAIFRLYPVVNKWTNSFEKVLEETGKDSEEGLPPAYPSLFRYYNLLPEVVRNDPYIINLTRCLEFGKHDMTLEQKEWALNYAAEFALPMDPILENACKEAVISEKYFAPLWEEITVIEEAERVDKAEKDVLAGLPGQPKKRSAANIDVAELQKMTSQGRPEHLKDVADWTHPPRHDPYVPEEDPFPVLPLDFYDNDDGFWDNYRNWKEGQLGSKPLMKHRHKFKH